MFNAKFFKDNGYLVVPKILSGELLDFIGIHAYNRARIEGVEKNPDGTIKDTQVPNTPSFYGDFVMENLQDFLLPKIESATGMKLLPTYTFFRVYKAGDILANKNPFDDANVFKKIDQAFQDIYDADENMGM